MEKMRWIKLASAGSVKRFVQLYRKKNCPTFAAKLHGIISIIAFRGAHISRAISKVRKSVAAGEISGIAKDKPAYNYTENYVPIQNRIVFIYYFN